VSDTDRILAAIAGLRADWMARFERLERRLNAIVDRVRSLHGSRR
jgi:ATP-dependent protease HslVU (ClpYQ) peptidase subunit